MVTSAESQNERRKPRQRIGSLLPAKTNQGFYDGEIAKAQHLNNEVTQNTCSGEAKEKELTRIIQIVPHYDEHTAKIFNLAQHAPTSTNYMANCGLVNVH